MDNLSDTETRTLAALTTIGTGTAHDVADAADLAYSTVARILRHLAETGLAVSEDASEHDEAGRRIGRKQPSRWRALPPPQDADTSDDNTAPDDLPRDPVPDADDSDEGAADQSPPEGQPQLRLAKGELREQVLTVLRANPDQEMGAAQVAAHLKGRSHGAIANALDRLVLAGAAQQTREAPRRYTATS